MMKLLTFAAACLAATASAEYKSEYKIVDDHMIHNSVSSLLPSEYIQADQLPDAFTWGDVDGVSYLTQSRNQHLPQCKQKE